MKYMIKRHINSSRLFLNVVDINLKGKIIEDKKAKIDLSKEYYDGTEMEEKTLLKMFEEAFSIQFIGNESVELGIKQGIIDNFSEIGKIKYTFYLRTTF